MGIRDRVSLEQSIKAWSELGICSTCIHLYRCSKSSRHGHTEWCCDDFENNERMAAKNRIIDPEDIIYILEGLKSNRKPNTGLCKNCEIRNLCRYPQTEEGKWNCTEYR